VEVAAVVGVGPEVVEVTEAAAWVAEARPVEVLVGAEAMAARAAQAAQGVAVATAAQGVAVATAAQGVAVATAGLLVAPPGAETMAAVEVE
jgi:hypothetical protein